MVSYIKKIGTQFQKNLFPFVSSVVMFQLLNLFILIPVISYLFYHFTTSSKINNLTLDTLSQVLSRPLSVGLGIFTLLVISFFIFLQIGYYFLFVIHQDDASLSFSSLIKKLIQKSKYFASFSVVYLLGYFLLLLPIVSFGIKPDLLRNIKIPNFIVDELLLSGVGTALYLALIIFFSYITLRSIYAIYFFVENETTTIKQAFLESWHFSKGKVVKLFLIFLMVNVVYFLTAGLIVALALLPLWIFETVFTGVVPVVAAITLTVVQILLMLITGLYQPVMVLAIMETIRPTELTEVNQVVKENFSIKKKHQPLIYIVGIGLFVALSAFNMYSLNQTLYSPDTAIIAHRGFMDRGVENSLSALKGSAEVGADFVELDIQETKDEELVVIHDTNLKRLTGVDKNIYDMTLSELRKLTLTQEGHTDVIPTLEEFIDQAKKDNIRLLIELKPHGHESPNYFKNLVSILKEKGVEKDYLVHSLDKTALDHLKVEDKHIQTGYILPLTIGALPKTEHDFLVLEEFSVTPKIIKEARELKIPLFVWTVNKDDLIKKYLGSGIEAIITNHPDRAVDFREENEEHKTFIDRIFTILER